MFTKSLILFTISATVCNAAFIRRQDEPTLPATTCQFLPIDCCAVVTRADNPNTSAVLATLGIVPKNSTLYAGIGCEPVQGNIGAGGDAVCGENLRPVCCETKAAYKIDADCEFVDLDA